MINLSSLEIKNKNLVIRVDMNVPILGGKVLDTTRITACIPTINYALKNNAKILLVSHLGRPTESVFEDQFSLKWNDPQIGINWPINNPILSKRDS